MKWRSIPALFWVLVLLSAYGPDHQPLQATSKEGTHTIRRLRVGGVPGFVPRCSASLSLFIRVWHGNGESKEW
jgi:hypothetical protein